VRRLPDVCAFRSCTFCPLLSPFRPSSAPHTNMVWDFADPSDNLSPSTSWKVNGGTSWGLIDPGIPSVHTLGTPFLNGVGELPMRDGWCADGQAFGMRVVGAVSAPADAPLPQFLVSTVLMTGATVLISC
jgi:hypothetical protein